jgi:hypothetical protein
MTSSIIAVMLPAFIVGVMVGVFLEHRARLHFNAKESNKSDD